MTYQVDPDNYLLKLLSCKCHVQLTSLDFIALYQTFDWLKLKMLESTVSVLPGSEWFSVNAIKA